MINVSSIKKKMLFQAPAMDYETLRREGIEHIARLGNKLWTDYNTHDPGITILEQLCYAITDLGYRINYDLPDILAENNESPYANLFGPADILTTNPVTLLDLRKLIVDIKGVKNAWIEKVAQPQPELYFHQEKNQLQLTASEEVVEAVYLQGLYQVWVELDIDFRESHRERIAKRLHACRNLCEDFTRLNILHEQDIQIDAKIEIDSVDNAAQLLTRIYAQIESYFSPPVRFYTLSELLDQGKSMDEIFDGPLLQQGFIDSSELQKIKRRSELRTSDLIQIIMQVEGVRAVVDIKFVRQRGEDGEPVDIEQWLLTINDSSVPRLDKEKSTITLLKNQLGVSIQHQHLTNSDKSSSTRPVQPAAQNEVPLPVGQAREIGDYLSIQHQFPDNYGINSNGLADTASPQRKAQSKQLKAYLLFFDQILANYFAQLAHVKELFSFSEDAKTTYFSQFIEDAELGLDEYQRNNLGIWANDKITRMESLKTITENPDGSAGSTGNNQNNDRKNRFLNHLLARFAEQFTDYSLALYGLEEPQVDKLISDKKAFLQNYPQLSSQRGTAFNYLLPFAEENRSGLEQRIRYKLGIESEEQFYLIEHILLRPIAEDSGQSVPILGDISHKDPYSLQISVILPDWPTRFQNQQFRLFVEQTVRDETPVHITVYIRWLDKQAMSNFEQAYNNENWVIKLRSQLINIATLDRESDNE